MKKNALNPIKLLVFFITIFSYVFEFQWVSIFLLLSMRSILLLMLPPCGKLALFNPDVLPRGMMGLGVGIVQYFLLKQGRNFGFWLRNFSPADLFHR